MRRAAFALAAAAALAGAPDARARNDAAPGTFITFPSGAIPDFDTLYSALLSLNPEITTVIFQKGTYLFSDPLRPLPIIGKNGFTFCGETGNPDDVTIESAADPAVQILESRDVTLRGMTIRTTAPFGSAVFAASVLSPEIESYADDVSILSCNLEGYYCAAAAVRAKNLTVADSRMRVTQPGGAGVYWQDGSGLFVTRTRFTTAPGISATAGLFVKGAQDDAADGRRARHLLITNNTVDGDFLTGFDLADVVDARVRGNRIEFPGPQILQVQGPQNVLLGRVGIVVRRAAATELTEDFHILRNTVHKAHYGIWSFNAGSSQTPRSRGRIVGNDLSGCGADQADDRFQDMGAAMRLNLGGGPCPLVIERNDFRDLASAIDEPAVVVFPPGREKNCFPDSGGNRVERRRPLYKGQDKRGQAR